MVMIVAGLVGPLLFAAVAALEMPKVTPGFDEQVVEECVAPANRNRLMSDLTAAQRTALTACAQGVTARMLNAQLPMQLDDLTTLERVGVEGATLVYYNRLGMSLAELPANARPAIERATRNHVCGQNAMVQTIGNGGSYGYVWRDQAGALVHRMVITSC